MLNRKQFTIYWGIIVTSLILCFVSVTVLSVTLKKRQSLNKNITEIISLGYLLSDVSDYLTMQARAFAVLGKPGFLRNYWNEVNNRKKRDYVIERIQQLGVPHTEIKILEDSKTASDRLIRTEQISMKLVLLANNVQLKEMPQELNDVDLSDELMQMTPNDKIIYAQKILFDHNYFNAKKIIHKNTSLFVKTITIKLNKYIETQNIIVFFTTLILYIFLLLSIGLLVLVIWINPIFFRNSSK